ncbi:glycosyltransferase family 2 protein [Agromyces cerinus]|uniref:Glycosyl transferase family 2 n=1 Tax=Agromyces cerinus subsp. cerinus TaxID=232089 RepID=A0A1N6DIA6_9MICO|nr:glycosyltransferase family 2 protein [Agromyces cerinus]SIN70541.1 Glycosyl transferase family 2 [Agromyces cerinus subsp. cerinus]
MLKVSVVVATYSSGPGLDKLVASLDAQTMPAEEFEVIFVDDGSPDDTVARLQRIAATRPNVRVERIENSGWASRPRNVGTDLAVGEYILFMDHDDELYPDALRAASEFARRAGADVLNGKEARTHDPGWALDTYRGDREQDLGREDAHPLIPMNPHKLYRAAFLRQHGIRFPEGRRVFWEDAFFNIEVAAHATTISTLTSVPFYHWVQTDGSGSTTFKRSDPAWWEYLDRVLESADRHLGRDSLQSHQLRRHQYRSRVLSSFVPAHERRPASERQLIEERARALQARFMDPTDDAALDVGALAVARALRLGDAAVLAHVAKSAGTDRFEPATLTSVRWEQGRLVIAATSSTVRRLPGGGTFRIDDERVLAVPAEVIGRIGTPDDFDVTDELDASSGAFAVRGRSSRIAWLTGGETTAREVSRTDDGHEARFSMSVAGQIDVRAAAAGVALDAQVWDVFLRMHRAGRVQQPRLRASTPALPTLIDGRPAVAYTNRDGFLSIDLGGTVTSLFDGSTPTKAMSVVQHDGLTSVTVDLPGVPVSGDGTGDGQVELTYRRDGIRSQLVGTARRLLRREHPATRFPVRYAVTEDGARATIELPSESGRYQWRPSERSPGLPSWALSVANGAANLTVDRA